MLATCRVKGGANMRGLGGLIMRTTAVCRRSAADSAAHGTVLAAVLLATRMCWLATFRHAEPFSPKLLRHRATEGTMTGVVVTHDLAPQGFTCRFRQVLHGLTGVGHAPSPRCSTVRR